MTILPTAPIVILARPQMGEKYWIGRPRHDELWAE